jgi:hypothetical protein
VRAFVILPVVTLGVQATGYRRVAGWLLQEARSRPARQDAAAAQDLARLVRAASLRSPVASTCLSRALVLCHLLRRQGLDARLCFGVARPHGGFAAHAWVEHDGEPLSGLEADGQAFAPLVSAPGNNG